MFELIHEPSNKKKRTEVRFEIISTMLDIASRLWFLIFAAAEQSPQVYPAGAIVFD